MTVTSRIYPRKSSDPRGGKRKKLEWWEALDEKIIAEDTAFAKKKGRTLGPLTYRRRFPCSFCGEETAIETYRDHHVPGLKDAMRDPLNQFHCSSCKWGTLPIRAELFPDEIARELRRDGRHAAVVHAIKIEALNGKRGRAWRRTDPEAGASAVYRTMTQLVAATAEQHKELSTVQSVKSRRPKFVLLNTPLFNPTKKTKTAHAR